MRVRREDFRGHLYARVAELRSPTATDWLTVLVTDLAADRQGRTA